MSTQTWNWLKTEGQIGNLIGRLNECGARVITNAGNSVSLTITAYNGLLTEEAVAAIKYFVECHQLTMSSN